MAEESGNVELPAAASGVVTAPASDGLARDEAAPQPAADESGLGADVACAGPGAAAAAAELDSLPGGDELALNGCAGSDSGVEGCGRALSSGGGSRSCASSVVSCGSGCGSESSSLAGAARPRLRRRVSVADPPAAAAAATPRARVTPPLGASTPRVVPRGPNLATRDRARSREKPTPPEKPRPLTPKPRARPTPDLPALARESPALRAKPTRTSAARCRTPNSPTDDGRWPAVGSVADKFATLPRRRRDGDSEGSPRRGASVGRDAPPPIARRPVLARVASSRGAGVRTRVRIYAETWSQTALTGADLEAGPAARGVWEAREARGAAQVVSRGVQAERREAGAERAEAALRRARAELQEERARRERAEAALEEERGARRAAQDELQRNTRRLLALCGGGGAQAGAGECLRALEEQLRAAADLAAAHRQEIDRLRDTCRTLQTEASAGGAAARALERRLAEAEAEAAEMQDFLGAEKIALQESLREAELELGGAQHELARRRAECRQLVRLCEQRRQEALAASARARGGCGGGAAAALDALARRLRALLDSLQAAHRIARDDLDDAVFYNDAYSRSDSGGGQTPDEPPSSCREPESACAGAGGDGAGGAAPRGSSLLAAVARAIRGASLSESRDDRSDNSADLLDSETEPCLVTDAAFDDASAADPSASAADYSALPESRRGASSLCIELQSSARRLERAEESCGSLHNLAAWSADELSPVRAAEPGDEASERESLRSLSAAILQRQRSEAECSRADDDATRAHILDKVVGVDNLLSELLQVLRVVQQQGDAAARQLDAVRERIGETERGVAEAVGRKLAELEASRAMLDHYKRNVEVLTARLEAGGESPGADSIDEELVGCDGEEVRTRYEALDACLAALGARQRAVAAWPRLAALQARLERLAFLLLAALPPPRPHHPHQPPAAPRTVGSAA